MTIEPEANRPSGVESDKTPSPIDAASRRWLEELIRSGWSLLNERERKVLEMRFGLLDGQDCTQKEIGDQFGVCRERIRQIEARALDKLRRLRNDMQI